MRAEIPDEDASALEQAETRAYESARDAESSQNAVRYWSHRAQAAEAKAEALTVALHEAAYCPSCQRLAREVLESA